MVPIRDNEFDSRSSTNRVHGALPGLSVYPWRLINSIREKYVHRTVDTTDAGSSKGKTPVFESGYRGSIPLPATTAL